MKLLNLLNIVANAAVELEFKPERFVEMLDKMGLGMLVIFIIIGVIILTTMVINRLFSNKKDK